MLAKSKRFDLVVSDELPIPLDEFELDQPEPASALLEKEDEESDSAAVVLEKVASSVASTHDSPETLVSEVQQQLELTSKSANSSTITALTSAPDSNEFLTDFWKKYFPEPDMNAYLKVFIEKMPEGPGRDVYLQLLLNRTESSPDHGRYLQEFRPLLRQ